MNIAIISSIKDPASINIKETLIDNFDFKPIEETFENNEIYQYTIKNNNEKNNYNQENSINKNNNEKNNNINNSVNYNKNNKEKIIKLYTINSKLVFKEELDKEIDADLFVFISKHAAAEGKKSLTIHPIGNFGKAEHGGEENKLCPCNSSFLKNIFLELNKNSEGSEFELTLESTHHGPYVGKPTFFIEIGSVEGHWKNKEAAKILAKSLISGFREDKKYESVFIIGGSHYNHIGNKVMLKSDYSVGHICAKYNLDSLDADLIRQALEKSNAKFVLLDWKGLGKEKQRIIEILEKNNIEYKRSDRFFG